MKVLQCVHNYPPEFRGGVERCVESLVGDLDGLGVESVVLSGSERSSEFAHAVAETHAGVSVSRLVGGRILRQPADPFRPDLAPLVDATLDRVRPDVVHVHHWWNLGSDLVRRAAARGIPAVVTLHDHFAGCARFFRLPNGTPCTQPQGVDACGPCLAPDNPLDAIELHVRLGRRHDDFRSELAYAMGVFAPSSSHADVLRRVFPETRIDVLPLGSPVVDAVPRPRRSRTLRLLHAGNLCRLKGVEFLADVVARAKNAGADVALTLAGPEVESGMRFDGAERFGPYDRDALRTLAAAHDVAALPSFALESYSYALDEVLRLGMPVLVSDRGAMRERVGGRGRVLPAGDVGAWVAFVVELARDPHSLDAMIEAPHEALASTLDHARAVADVYASVRGRIPRTPNLEAGSLSRLAHLEGRVADILTLAGRARGPESP